MHGNLAEWTTAVENTPNAENADVSDASPTFVLRGGSFDTTVDACASSAREVVASRVEARKRLDAGFRIALAPVDEPETPEADKIPQEADAENQPVETPENAPVAK